MNFLLTQLEIPQSLMDLKRIKVINLAYNLLTGPPKLPQVPPDPLRPWDGPQLQKLYLSNNFLTGGLPSSISTLNSVCFIIFWHYEKFLRSIGKTFGNQASLFFAVPYRDSAVTYRGFCKRSFFDLINNSKTASFCVHIFLTKALSSQLFVTLYLLTYLAFIDRYEL